MKTRKNLSLRISILWTSILIAAAFFSSAHAEAIDEYFDSFANEWVGTNPNLAVSTRYFTGDRQDKLDRELTPQSKQFRDERTALAQRGIAGLKQFDGKPLSQMQRLSAEFMKWQLQSFVDGAKYADYDFPLDQFQGANVMLPEAFTLRHPFNTPRDVENFAARLKQLGPRMDEAVAESKRLIAAKKIPPKFIIVATIASMKTFADASPDQNPIAVVFAQKAAAVKDLTAERRSSLQAEVIETIRSQVYPSWRNALAMLDSILPSSSDNAGLWRYSDGAAAYSNALARFTTTTMTAEQIHQTGLKQVARIEAQMDTILRSLGRKDGSVQDRMKKLEQDLRYPNWASDEARAQIMKDIDAMIADSIERSKPMFERTPVTKVIAQPFPRFREAAAAANYNSAPIDRSRPAIFQMPLRESRMTKLGLRTLVNHETVPGHHFQVALEGENTELPRFRRSRAIGGISALSEGWALYAERIAAEEGWYAKDPEGLLGQLNAELFRARRLVVDTGLHAKKWTRQQAIDYGVEPSEIERYVVNPGQACSYMIGQLKLIELRDRARQKLGAKFSFKDFHRVVLDTGTMPLGIVEKEVDRYIAEKLRLPSPSPTERG